MKTLHLVAPSSSVQFDHWQRLVASEPSKLVRIFSDTELEHAPTGPPGESSVHSNAFAALISIGNYAGLKNGGRKDAVSAWAGLVRAGVVDCLCLLIEETRIEVDTRGMSTSQGFTQEMVNSWQNDTSYSTQYILELLCNAMTMSKPLTSTDTKVIASIVKHWASMSRRIWEDPGQSLGSEQPHPMSLTVYGQLCHMSIEIHPNILSQMYVEGGLTIPLITRFWRYATTEQDIKTTTIFLEWILDANHPAHVPYIQAKGNPSATMLLDQLYQGAGPKPTSPRSTQVTGLMNTVAKYIPLSPALAQHQLNLLLLVSRLSVFAKEPSTHHGLRFSGSLWSQCFTILRKPIPEEGDPLHASLVDFTFGLMMNALQDAVHTAPDDVEPLLKLWVDQGLFDALDKNIENFVTIPQIHKHLALIATAIEQSSSKLSPALTQKLRLQFPRWRTAGTLVHFDIVKQNTEGAPADPPSDGSFPPPEHPVWRHACWQMFGKMQNVYFDWILCGRRTCGKPGTILCTACSEVQYCSSECQTKDSQAHKVACPFMRFVKVKDLHLQSTMEVGVEKPAPSLNDLS